MERVPFGGTGATVAPLGVGALDVADPERAAALVHRLLDAGCNLVDSAACYPGHENFLGERFSSRREEFLLVTKCGHHEELPDGRLRSRPVAMADVDGALTRLRTDRVDAMLLHSYDLDLLREGEAMAVLRRAREQGKVRWIGYSGDGAAAVEAVRQGAQVIECSVSIADQANLVDLLPLCREHGVGVIAKKPIAAAAWRFCGRREKAHPANRAYVDRLATMALDPAEFGCAEMGELALRFTLAAVDCAIVSTTSESHQDANLAAVEAGPLSADTVGRVRERLCAAAGDEEWPACN